MELGWRSAVDGLVEEVEIELESEWQLNDGEIGDRHGVYC